MSSSSYQSISMKEAMNQLNDDTILLDVRRSDEFASGHIPGAINVSNEEIQAGKIDSLIEYKDEIIYVYCRSGNRSKQASAKLAEAGFEKIVEIGGILDYQGELHFD